MAHLLEFVIPKIMASWDDVAYGLRYEIPDVDTIKAQSQNDVKRCCKRLFTDWLSSKRGAHPKAWSTLLEKLQKIEELQAVVEDIEAKLKQPQIVAEYFK